MKLCELGFSTYEVTDNQLYIHGFAQTTLSTQALPFYIDYLDVALTKEEVDELVRATYDLPKHNDVFVATKYLSGHTLETYLTESYGTNVALFVCDEIRFCVSNLRGIITEARMQEESSARRPGYLMRGKSVTPTQALELFIRSEESTCAFLDAEFRRTDIHFDTLFTSSSKTQKYTGSVCSWIGFDGTIGTDGITQKYPTMLEYIQELTQLAGWFPFLDLMIVIAHEDEWYDGVTIQSYLDGERTPAAAFIVKDGLVHVLDTQNSNELFTEYYNNYDVNLKNGTPVTYYNWTDSENIPYSVYQEETHKKFFRPCGEDATDAEIEAFLKTQNILLRERYGDTLL